MLIDPAGEARVGVIEALTHDAIVDPIHDEQAGVGVTHRAEANPRHPHILDELLEKPGEVAWAQVRADLRREYEVESRSRRTEQLALPHLLLAVRPKHGDVFVLNKDGTARHLRLGALTNV